MFIPIFMTPKNIRGGFSRGAKFFPNEYAETNISAKFDAFIHDVNARHIFDHKLIRLAASNCGDSGSNKKSSVIFQLTKYHI